MALRADHQQAPRRGAATSIATIQVTLDDIALANQLAPEVLGRSLDELPPQTRRLLGHIRDLVRGKRQRQGTQAPATFGRKELRDARGWSLTQSRS